MRSISQLSDSMPGRAVKLSTVDRQQLAGVDITIEQMLDGIFCQPEIQPIQWSEICCELRDWIAGNHDTDGCSSVVYKHGLRITVSKAENGWATLETLKQLLGGQIYHKMSEDDNHQVQRAWSISGKAAVDFCKEIQHHVLLKEEQLALGAKYPVAELQAMQMKPVKGMNIVTQSIVNLWLYVDVNGEPNQHGRNTGSMP